MSTNITTEAISNMTLMELIDYLPTDILLNCANYIYLPPKSLLKEIEHYGKVNKAISYLLKKWYYINAKDMISELDSDHEGIMTLVSSGSRNEIKRKTIYFIKKLIMILPSNIVNNIVMRYKYEYTL
jgi:hypothetical protein